MQQLHYLYAMLLWPFLIIHAALLSSLVLSTVTTNATDQEALLAFKNQISGISLSSWNHSLHLCQWQGVTCSRRHDQRVTALNVSGLGLVGTISPSIGNLTFLDSIDLRENKFHGKIPPEIGRLFRLKYLNLSQNSIGGEIPANLTRCWGLTTIDFSYNSLTGRIPFELGFMSKLRVLSLSVNFITGNIPSSFGNLSSLTYLNLLRNGLEGDIPEDLGQIANLVYLGLSANNLSGFLPPTLYNLSSVAFFLATANQLRGNIPSNLGVTLPNLVEFFVAQNRFTGPIPVSLSNASRLEQIAFSDNQFSGSIPMDLGRLGGLQSLNLERNMLGIGEAEDMGFLSSLTNCSLLWSLSLSYNQLTGALPNSIANLSTHLSELYLGINQLFGSIPSGIGNLFNLNVLGLSYNLITGTIPVDFGKLNKLQVLNLRTNRLSGEIPTSVGNITRLFQFLVAENNLQGNIPPSLGNCQQLLLLHLAHNNLSGSIPKQVFDIEPLQFLSVTVNSLVGSLPVEVGNLNSLRILIVSENKLSGEIPSSLDNCLSLEYLYVDSNFFRGAIPPLSSLKGLIEMDVSHNNFSGRIPDYLEKFKYLRYLNLSFNDVEGEVPREGIFKNASAISVNGNRKLCGGIAKLSLPACTSQATKKKRRPLSSRATIAIIIGSSLCLVLLLSLFAALYWWTRKSKKHPSSIAHPLGNQFLNISYADLFKATDGFSSTNLIGVGSYGSVYKGSLDRLEMVVAVKVLNLQRRGASKSFIDECTALRNVRHRNLLKVLSACSSIDSKGDDFKALVFEYMANGNLDQWLHPDVDERHQDRNLSFIQRLNIAIDVASALDYLHNSSEKPIAHCDLKPSNVLLDDDLNAHVGDFGLARFLSEATSNASQNHNNSSGIRGTIGYVAPEYGVGGNVSTCGDIYSYGILLLEILTGKKPSHEMFNESLSLHQFAKLALPDNGLEIIDRRLLSVEAGGLNNQIHTNVESRLEKSLISMVKIGVACSITSLKDRMEISDVVVEMHAIRDSYLGV